MEALCTSTTPADVNWGAQIHDAGWYYHVRTMLSGGLFVAEALHRKGQSVLVHWCV